MVSMRRSMKRINAENIALHDLKQDYRKIKQCADRELYAMLGTCGWIYDNVAKKWLLQSDLPPKVNAQAGLVHLRVMAMAEDIPAALQALKTAHNVIEVSQEYNNRKDAGVRVYVTIKI